MIITASDKYAPVSFQNLIKKDTCGAIVCIGNDNDFEYTNSRKCRVTSEGVQFSIGNRITGNSTYYAIPQSIYGVKKYYL